MTLTKTPLRVENTYASAEETDLDKAGIINIRNGPCTLYAIRCLSPAQGVADETVYIKLYDSDGDGLVLGTTKPTHVIPIVIDQTNVTGHGFYIPGGYAFTSGLCALAVTQDGNDVTTDPTQNLYAEFITKDD